MVFNYRKKLEVEKFLESQYAYKNVEYGMAIMGLKWMPELNEKYRKVFNLWSFTILTLLEVYFPIAWLVAFLTHIDSTTPGEQLGSLAIFFNVLASAIKMIILLFNRWRIDKAKDMLKIMYKRCIKSEERLKVDKWVKRCNTFTILYVVAYLTTPVLMLISALFSGHVPINIYIPLLDWRRNNLHLRIATVIEMLLLATVIPCFALLDCMFFIFGLSVRDHMKLLIQRVEILRNDPESNEDDNYEELVQCIMDHKLILEYCANMRPLLTNSMFVQFTVMGLVLACTLIQLMFFANFLTALSLIWFMGACFIQLFPICLTCDQILDDCDELSLTIFHSNWIGAERRYTTALKHFIHNAQKPIQFMGGGILPICLATYSQMVKMGFSLITFVRQMNIFEGVQ